MRHTPLFRSILLTLAALLLLSSLAVSVYAATENEGTIKSVHKCETVDYFSSNIAECTPTLSTDRKEGKTSVQFQFKREQLVKTQTQYLMIIQLKGFEPMNVSTTNSFSFDYYINYPALYNTLDNGQFELTSSGQCDVEETGTSASMFKNLKAGWNQLGFAVNAGGMDKTRFNYIRFYCWFDKEALDQLPDWTYTIRFDNLRFSNYDYTMRMQDCSSLGNVSTAHEVKLDTVGFTEGGSAYYWQLTPRTDTEMIMDISFDKTYDLLGCSLIEFDFYISNMDYLKEWIVQTKIRLGTGEKPVLNYLEWDLFTDNAYPLGLGWNHIVLSMQRADSYGDPDIHFASMLTIFFDSIETELHNKTTFRLDNVATDSRTISMNVGINTGTEGMASGLKYQDDDVDHYYDPPAPVEQETEPETEIETEKETGKPGESESESKRYDTMLEEADAREGENNYTTAHAKVVARVTAISLVVLSLAVTALAAFLRFRKT